MRSSNWFWIVSICSASLFAGARAQDPPRPGPWDLDLVLLESPDGLVFGGKRTFVPGGGVPTLIADARGQLIAAFQWFPPDRQESFDRVAVSRSLDDGRTWSDPQPVRIEEMPRAFRRPFDPTLLELPGGRYRLYFTSHRVKEDRDRGPPEGEEPAIYSASGEDAVHYRFEPGPRFRVEGEKVIDCAAARLGEDVHLFAPVEGKRGTAYHAVSRDGLEFRRLPDLHLDIEGSWLGCAVAVEGGLRFYGTGRGGWSAISRDGLQWTLDATDATPRRSPGADPGVARAKSGRYLMIATDAPARPRGRPAPGTAGDRAPGFPPVGPAPLSWWPSTATSSSSEATRSINTWPATCAFYARSGCRPRARLRILPGNRELSLFSVANSPAGGGRIRGA